MQVFAEDFRESPKLLNECSMTIGNFDGVHRGHRLLIDEMIRGGGQHQIPTAVLTFSPHPSHVLGKSPVAMIYPLESQILRMKNLGVSHLFIQKFDKSFSQMPSKDFLRQYLFRLWDPRVLVVGDDFGFGQSKSGGRELLREECEDRGCHWRPCQTLSDSKGRRISSSLAREALVKGDIEFLNDVLGEPYFIAGEVVAGAKLGRTLGFPTANIRVEDRLYPKNGVYYGIITSMPEKPWALMNVGVRPTVRSEKMPLSVECHILDYSGDLYGKPLAFEFKGRLRDEKRFGGKEELVAQMHKDLDQVKAVRQKELL